MSASTVPCEREGLVCSIVAPLLAEVWSIAAMTPPLFCLISAALLSVPLPVLIEASALPPDPFCRMVLSLALPFWSIWPFSDGPSCSTVTD